MKKYSVEIVVPIYNEGKELENNIKALHAFLKKNLRDYSWHITIADNASTDECPSIAKKLSKNFHEIKYLRLSQKGRGRAVKKAWSESKADILI